MSWPVGLFLLLAAGYILARWSAAVALGLLLFVSSFSSSSAWYITGENYQPALFLAMGILAACLPQAIQHTVAGSAATSPRNPAQPLTTHFALVGMIAVVAVSTLIHVAHDHPFGVIFGAVNIDALVRFSPVGLEGLLQQALITFVGPLLGLCVISVIRGTNEERVLRGAMWAAASVAILSPAVQWLLDYPTVARPDQNVDSGTGLVGFFQDPHSYAPYLLLSISVFAGCALVGAGAARRLAAGAMAGAGVLTLLLTNSREGLLGAAVSGAALLLLAAMTRGRRRAVVTATALLMIGGGLIVVPQTRHGIYELSVRAGNARMWQVFSPDPSQAVSIDSRLTLWGKGVSIVEDYPLWGVGAPRTKSSNPSAIGLAAGSADFPAQNVHNYYLQLSSEYGIAALAGFVLWLFVLARGLLRAARNDDGETRWLAIGVLSGSAGLATSSLFGHPLMILELQVAFWMLGAIALSGSNPNLTRSVR